MGLSFRSVGALPSPFLLVDERLTEIPAGSSLLNKSAAEFKFVVLLEGKFRQRVDDGMPFSYRAGDAAIFPCACRQEIIPVDQSRASVLRAVRILFRNEAVFRARQAGEWDDSLEGLLIRECQRPVILPGFLDEEAGVLLRRLRDEADGGSLGRKLAIFGILTGLLVLALRRLRPAEPCDKVPPLARSVAIVRRAEAFMGAHFTRRLVLEEIAWDQTLSAEHLARVFREVTGKTVFEHLDAVRIDAAKGMLVQPAPSIAVVAQRCGFGSPTRFGIHFKSQTGMTPSGYRAALGFTLRHQANQFRKTGGRGQ